MISLLHIENIAVIERADIEFEKGFNVFTGETGAGKSIVIDAISAVMGERTSRDIVRTGENSALVSAVFCDLPELSWFRDNGAAPDEDGALLLQREIHVDGKNVCRVNGRPITVSQLRSLGTQLLNIHGQHDGQQLLNEQYHLIYLDRFGETDALRSHYRKCYDTMLSLRKQMLALNMDESEKTRKMDNLRYQIGELERAGLKIGEEEALAARRNILRHAERLIEAMETAHYSLSGDDDSAGAVSQMVNAQRALSGAADISEELAVLSSRLAELRYASEDIAEQVRDIKNSFDFSPDELDQIESRLDIIYRFKKKYGNTVAEMLEYLKQCKAELDGIEYAGDTMKRLEEKLKEESGHVKAAATELSSARKKAARQLEERILSELKQLDMNRVQFSIEFSDKQPDETGVDEIHFLMSANVGEALRPINKVASGGELARIMLALKNVLAENDDVSTLVFDEVDTGVSGRAAQRVAEKLVQVARTKQVLCVTHLPQIAAMADSHFSVEKAEANGRTYTAVRQLDFELQKQELARITGGTHITETTLNSAAELLEAARTYKNKIKR